MAGWLAHGCSLWRTAGRLAHRLLLTPWRHCTNAFMWVLEIWTQAVRLGRTEPSSQLYWEYFFTSKIVTCHSSGYATFNQDSHWLCGYDVAHLTNDLFFPFNPFLESVCVWKRASIDLRKASFVCVHICVSVCMYVGQRSASGTFLDHYKLCWIASSGSIFVHL